MIRPRRQTAPPARPARPAAPTPKRRPPPARPSRARAVCLALSVLVLPTRAPAAPPRLADATAFARVRAHERARIELIRRLAPATACLFNHGSRAGGGSGVLIDEHGYGLTNFHVVAGMLEDRIGDAGLPDGKIYEIDVLGIDPTGDVALFQARGRKTFPFVELGDSDALAVGDYTLAMGNPFLLAEDYTPTVTLGIVSGLHRYQRGAGAGGRALRYTDCIQVDTSINPGNSGGPLFDLAGRLVGINGRISLEERQAVNVGVGYAISINQIKRFIPMLRAGLPVRHATAGFTVFDRGSAVVVDQILDDSAAYRAGLRLGDAIRSFGDRAIRSANEFMSRLGTYPANWPVTVEYERAGRPGKTAFRLEDLPLPELEAGAPVLPGFGAADPYGPHPVTDAANRRAVRRALRHYHRAIGGRAAATGLKQMQAQRKRTLAAKPAAPPAEIRLVENRKEAVGLKGRLRPVDLERAIRWTLLEAPTAARRRDYKVVGADEIGGRIAVILEHRSKTAPGFRLALDDQDGRLLRIEFRDPITGKAVRYEYDDYRRVGRMRLPHTRRLFLDDALYAVDRFTRIGIKG